MIISSASTVQRRRRHFPDWVITGCAADYLCAGWALSCGDACAAPGRLCVWVGKGGIEAISRLMGFLLVCMGVQFIINGVLEIITTYHDVRLRRPWPATHCSPARSASMLMRLFL